MSRSRSLLIRTFGVLLLSAGALAAAAAQTVDDVVVQGHATGKQEPQSTDFADSPKDDSGMVTFPLNDLVHQLNEADTRRRMEAEQRLVDRGAELARLDPLATALRNQQPVGDARRGFDIGMAVAETDTHPGPSKQAIHDSLSRAGQGGFSAAVSFSLARNRKKITDLAPQGAALASQDPLAQSLRDQQSEGPARLGFDIGMAAAEGQTLAGPNKQRMHDSLRAEEQAGFAAAVEFSLARNRQKLADMAPSGEALANEDPLALELRDQQADGPLRMGFDIGMAAAEGQTAPGPNKQRIRDSLYPSEQPGFDAAVRFSLDRNRSANLAAVGATIAQSDPVVLQARQALAGAFCRLGFDIATGIFGDPGLGALGNTASGPGSLGIRAALNAAAQQGFNASMALHLSRNYRP